MPIPTSITSLVLVDLPFEEAEEDGFINLDNVALSAATLARSRQLFRIVGLFANTGKADVRSSEVRMREGRGFMENREEGEIKKFTYLEYA
jgi:hypothetical protein